MKYISRKNIFYILALFLLFPKQAYAYLDPGNGSYFFQLLIAGFLGGSFFIKSAFGKIRNMFKSKIKKGKDKNDEER